MYNLILDEYELDVIEHALEFYAPGAEFWQHKKIHAIESIKAQREWQDNNEEIEVHLVKSRTKIVP